MATPYGPDIKQAYQQVWPELRRPQAGSTAPEWIWKLRATAGAPSTPLPRPELVHLQAVNRASTY